MKKVSCILLVDDSEADNEFHKIIIQESEVCDCVQVANTAIKALEYIIKAGEPDQECPKPELIYLDINMPGMNGFEFLDKYHQLDDHFKSRITVIMLTTSLNPDDEHRAKEIKEVTEFQNKPMSVATIRETVEKYF